ncbi:MAG TPA: MarR family transcriptional regulator [Comamonas sp.]|uniref:MarR family winged helix-turn-helix transcriptional regulator n=1 Tax=Comamonas halotolerans TaxID=3041496 RepID=UPI0024E07583|nr:MarR family transcriptional regulator [Comamonas sp. NoAH]
MSHPFESLSGSELHSMPGHGIRRLQQIAVALFMQEMDGTGLTPVQFAVLQALALQPGVDQKTLAHIVSFDTSTIGAVIDRLESKQMLTRSLSPEDRRVRLLHLTAEGKAQLEKAWPAVLRTQARILQPLNAKEQQVFAELLRKLCDTSRLEGH